MSTAIFIFLAVVIIFWHPPFQMPLTFKKIFRPVILVILLILLLFIGALESYTHINRNNFSTAKNGIPIQTSGSKLTR